MGARWGAGGEDHRWTGRRFVVALISGVLLVGATDALAAKSPPNRLTPSAGTESLGLDLLGKLPPGNTVISPDSITTALAMAGTGAKGATARQIAAVLHLSGPTSFDSVGGLQHSIFAAQAAAAAGNPAAPTLTTANGLFVQSGFPLNPGFVGGLTENFGATPESLDFERDELGAVAAINSWTSANTNGVIPELLSKIPSATRLVLANAVYLKAKWRHEFEASKTAPAPFHRSTGNVSAEFMHQEHRFLYGAGPGYQAVDLPYRASDLSMLVVLPTAPGVGKLESLLGQTGLPPIVDGLAPTTVRLSLPRFHLKAKIDLNRALEALGMTLPFHDADFSGITSAAELKIGEVRHIADIDVDEEGTAAAAVTAIRFVGKSLKRPVESVVFNADHPFLFFVRDDKTGAILFAGRLTNPQGT